MNNENRINPNINEQLSLENNPFNILCRFLFQNIAIRLNIDDKEQGQVSRLLQNAYRYLFNDIEHVANN